MDVDGAGLLVVVDWRVVRGRAVRPLSTWLGGPSNIISAASAAAAAALLVPSTCHVCMYACMHYAQCVPGRSTFITAWGGEAPTFGEGLGQDNRDCAGQCGLAAKLPHPCLHTICVACAMPRNEKGRAGLWRMCAQHRNSVVVPTMMGSALPQRDNGRHWCCASSEWLERCALSAGGPLEPAAGNDRRGCAACM